VRFAPQERWLRSLLALAIVACTGTAAWTGGCGRNTVVQPDASSSDSGGAHDGAGPDAEAAGNTDLGQQDLSDLGSDGSMLNEDAQPDACCQGSEHRRCRSDTQRIACDQWDTVTICGAHAGGPYAHVWTAYDCPNGCEAGECRP